MKFAGFMGAMRDDRLRREEREEAAKQAERDYTYRKKLQDADWDRRSELEGLKLFSAQREKDGKLAADTDFVMQSLGLPAAVRPYVSQAVSGFGGAANVIDMYQTGRIEFDAPTGAVGGKAVEISGDAEEIKTSFMSTVEAGGVTNPFALSAIAATAYHESGFKPGNVARTWDDPSETGRPGTAGGIMSWNNDRLRALQNFTGGNLTPQAQAQYFLQEDPTLIKRLNEAGSVEEAVTLMNNAWRFAGYNRPGGEAAARLRTAQQIYQTEMALRDTGSNEVISARGPATEGQATPAPQTASTDTPTPRQGGMRIVSSTELANKKRVSENIDWFRDKIQQSDKVEELIALEGSIKSDTRLTPEESNRMITLVGEQKELLLERERRVAIEKGDPMMWFPSNENGMLASAAGVRLQPTSDGWVDPTGNPIDTTGGLFFPVEDGMENLKIHNTKIREMVGFTAAGVNAAQALAVYRNAIVENPQSLNKYSNFVGGFGAEIAEIEAAINTAVSDGVFTPQKQGELLGRFQEIAAGAGIVDMTLLNAAYAMAALKGSTGQALSDKELTQNLQALGMGKANPETVLSMINTAFNDMVVNNVQTRRQAELSGLYMTQSGKAFLSQTNLYTPFDQVVEEAFQSTSDARLIGAYEAMRNGDTTIQQGVQTGSTSSVGEAVDGFMGGDTEETADDLPVFSLDEVTSPTTLEEFNVSMEAGKPTRVTQELIDAYPDIFTPEMLNTVY
jgi:hypothetical protein